jgi:hypothetical protein
MNVQPLLRSFVALVAAFAAAGAAADVVTDWNTTAYRVMQAASVTLTRTFGSTAALAEEQRMVRIWGGIHFRNSLDASERMGRALVAHMLETAYRPQH